MPLYMITASIRTANTGGEYATINFPSRDNEVRNHNQRLQAEGFEVLEVKVSPFDSALYVEQEAAPTAGMGELADENSITDETTGSSD